MASRDYDLAAGSALERENDRLARLELDIEAYQAIIDHFRPRFEAAFANDAERPLDRLALYPHVIPHEHTVKEWRQELADRRAIISSAEQAVGRGPGMAPNPNPTEKT